MKSNNATPCAEIIHPWPTPTSFCLCAGGGACGFWQSNE